MNHPREEVGPFLPQRIRAILDRAAGSAWDELEEIRLRLGRPLALHGRRGERFLTNRASVPRLRVRPGKSWTKRCSSSAALPLRLRRGAAQRYITIPGGRGPLRPGGGRRGPGGAPKITGLNHRIARQITGAALPYVRFFYDQRRTIYSLLRPRRAAERPPSCATWPLPQRQRERAATPASRSPWSTAPPGSPALPGRRSSM